jgi:hypothetical protein
MNEWHSVKPPVVEADRGDWRISIPPHDFHHLSFSYVYHQTVFTRSIA